MPPSPVKVLLVEDSPSDAVLLQESLTQNDLGGFEFTHVDTLAEGLARLGQTRFDIMLLDLSLPDSSGPDTFLRTRTAAPQLPIVVLTGSEDEAVGLDAVRHGIQDYLIKGQAYGRQTARAIHYAIERKRAEEALKSAEAALQHQRDQLEIRVAQRTAELSETNLSLQAEIAQRQRAEHAHQQVLRRLSEAQETERGRISRELHDRLGQDLTALKLGLQLIRAQGPFTAAVQHTISNLETLANGLMQDVHRLAWELRPSVLDDLGLEMALHRYVTEWSATTAIPLDFHSTGDGAPSIALASLPAAPLDPQSPAASHRLPLEYETALYRVAQEALTNVVRHARASRVSVLLERRPGCVSLIIEDNGQGFDADAVMRAPATQGKLGLLGMQERVKLIGGSLEIESTPGAGATVFVRLPLEPRRGAANLP